MLKLILQSNFFGLYSYNLNRGTLMRIIINQCNHCDYKLSGQLCLFCPNLCKHKYGSAYHV